MSVTDVLTVAVLAFVGVRIASGTRLALAGPGRGRVGIIVRGLRLRHFIPPIPVLCVVVHGGDRALAGPAARLRVVVGARRCRQSRHRQHRPHGRHRARVARSAVLHRPARPRAAAVRRSRGADLPARLRSAARSGNASARASSSVSSTPSSASRSAPRSPSASAAGTSRGGTCGRTDAPAARVAASLESTRAHLAYNLTVVVIVLAVVLLLPAGSCGPSQSPPSALLVAAAALALALSPRCGWVAGGAVLGVVTAAAVVGRRRRNRRRGVSTWPAGHVRCRRSRRPGTGSGRARRTTAASAASKRPLAAIGRHRRDHGATTGGGSRHDAVCSPLRSRLANASSTAAARGRRDGSRAVMDGQERREPRCRAAGSRGETLEPRHGRLGQAVPRRPARR